jgi:O-antigen/teichoic acid export membrane protein
VLDQGISSLSNFILGIVVARELPAREFGAFALAFVTFSFVINASRGPSTDPLIVRFSGAPRERWRPAAGAALGTALSMGVVSGVLCLLVGLLIGGDIGTGFVALAVGLPGILLQDSCRFAFFSLLQGHRAFLNDLVWGILQTATLVVLATTDHLTIASSLLAFGGTATVAAVFGSWQLRIAPHVAMVRSWLVEQRTLGGRYLIENVSIGGARQLRMVVVGALAGLASVAEVRAAEILMGPFMTLLAGVSQVSVPEAREVLLDEPRRLIRFCLTLASVQGAGAVLWTVTVLVVLPMGVGQLLIQDLWQPTHKLLFPLGLVLILGCFENSASAGLRALGASRRSLASQLTGATLYVVLGGLGAGLGGAYGSMWGVFCAMSLTQVMWWSQLRRGLRDHVASVEAAPIPVLDR